MSSPARIAVIGGGTIGAAVAALACRRGIATVLSDVDGAATWAAVRRVTAELERRVRRSLMTTTEADAAGALLSGSADLTAIADAELVLEAVPERRQLKRDLLARVERIAPTAVLASSSSSIPVAAIADAVVATERVVGFRFYEPPDVARLVELVTTPATSHAATATATALAAALGKQVVTVADRPVRVVGGSYAGWAAR